MAQGPSDTDPTAPAIQPSKIVSVGSGQASSPGSPAPASSPDADTDPGPAPKNDSIDTLLDGITGPRADKVKTQPTSAGSAAAAYGTSHRPQPKHDTPPYEPSIIVDPEIAEPAKLPRSKVATIKLDREAVAALRAATPGLAPPAPGQFPQNEAPTFVTPPRAQHQTTSGRLYLVIGSVLVAAVLALLIVGRLWANRVKQSTASAPAATTAPAATQTSAPQDTQAPPPPATTVAEAPPLATQTTTAEAPAAKPTATATVAAAATTATAKPKPVVRPQPTWTSDNPYEAPPTPPAPKSNKIDRDYRLGE
jgi:hypothetical protein